MDIPLLADLLPKNWDPRTVEYEKEIDEACRRVFSNRSYNSLDASERERRSDLIDQLLQERIKRYQRALQAAGLDGKISEVTHDLGKFLVPRSTDTDIGEHLPISQYSAQVSFMLTLLGPDLTNRKIIEIGPGLDGINILDYLASKGAEAIGLDMYDFNEEDMEKSKARIVRDRWENLSLHFEPGTIDAVYVKFMHDQPYLGGPFYNPAHHPGGTKYNEEPFRRLRGEALMRFEDHIAREMHKVLRPRGLFLIGYIDQIVYMRAEYYIHNDEKFEEVGFKHDLFKTDEPLCKYLSVYQKVARFRNKRESKPNSH